ncbi:MAG TPA: hypothetical protein VKQ08_11450, partial [Cyclobacteriaceae bacterium]|nr:hypothetical protein [Cyclobacteriaceae bacterium]
MSTTFIIEFFILLPLAGFVITLLIPQENEDLISTISFSAVGLHLSSIVLFIGYWLFNGLPVFDHNYLTLYQTDDYDFFIDLYFDKITAVYLLVG